MGKTSPAFDSEIQRRANESIAHGALTNSKRPSCFIKGIYPTHLTRGQGCRVWDTKGNPYIDFICGLGTNILGYANEEVNGAIREQLNNGNTLSLGTEIEVRLAEKVKEFIPFVDQVRFLKTGSEACTAAVRIARAKTGKTRVLSDGYHGWHDSFTSLTPPAFGVPEDCQIERLRDFEQIKEGNVAAVIIEPVITDSSDIRRSYLNELRRHCTETATTLIFDEIITGFRTPKGTYSNLWGIEPDLICLGKAIANGSSLSVVAGKRAFMEAQDYFVSSTFAGETLSIAAALKTITLLQTKYSLTHLWGRGLDFCNRFNQIWPQGLVIEGYGTRGVFKGNKEIKDLFFQESCHAGMLFGPSWFFCFPHIDVADYVLSSCKEVLNRIQRNEVKLLGEPSQLPYAQKVRNS